MNRTVTLSSAVILAAAIAPPLAGAEEKEGWKSLFDGKTLNGWIQKNGTATYRVEDGAIIGKTTKGSPNSFLCTEKEYGDFELEFAVKLMDNQLNSGVQIRSQTKPLKNKQKNKEGKQKFGRVNGPQVEIEASGKKGAQSGCIYGEACGGWMSSKETRKPNTAFVDGEWNTYRVVAQGPRIRTWINGKQIEDLTGEKHYKTHPKGFIGLQVHGVGNRGPFQVAWRKIRIKVLDK